MPTLIAFADDKAINRNTFEQKVNSFDDLSLVLWQLTGMIVLSN